MQNTKAKTHQNNGLIRILAKDLKERMETKR